MGTKHRQTTIPDTHPQADMLRDMRRDPATHLEGMRLALQEAYQLGRQAERKVARRTTVWVILGCAAGAGLGAVLIQALL